MNVLSDILVKKLSGLSRGEQNTHSSGQVSSWKGSCCEVGTLMT